MKKNKPQKQNNKNQELANGDFILNNEKDETTNSLEVSKLKQNLTPNQKNEKIDKQKNSK